jgi:hypothetical protein
LVNAVPESLPPPPLTQLIETKAAETTEAAATNLKSCTIFLTERCALILTRSRLTWRQSNIYSAPSIFSYEIQFCRQITCNRNSQRILKQEVSSAKQGKRPADNTRYPKLLKLFVIPLLLLLSLSFFISLSLSFSYSLNVAVPVL